MGSNPTLGTTAGLCTTCRYLRIIETRTGSRFFYCRRADSDDRFVKYPVVPVLDCIGYERFDAASEK